MNKDSIKLFLIIMTIIIDIILLNIFFRDKKDLNCYDYYIILLIIFIHIIFIISILINYNYLIIYSHVSIYIILFLSLFTQNKKLILLFIFFCIILKILWMTGHLCLILAISNGKKIRRNIIGKYINLLVTIILIILLIKYFDKYINKYFNVFKNKYILF